MPSNPRVFYGIEMYECNRSFAELKLWNRLKNEDFKWTCTNCNVTLTRDQSIPRKMEFGCRKCGNSFDELQEWGWLKFCGDHWKCKSCDNDITNSPEAVMEFAERLAHDLGKDFFVPMDGTE